MSPCGAYSHSEKHRKNSIATTATAHRIRLLYTVRNGVLCTHSDACPVFSFTRNDRIPGISAQQSPVRNRLRQGPIFGILPFVPFHICSRCPTAGASVFPVSRGLGVCQVRQHGPYRHQIRIKLNAIGVGYGISGRVSFDSL